MKILKYTLISIPIYVVSSLILILSAAFLSPSNIRTFSLAVFIITLILINVAIKKGPLEDRKFLFYKGRAGIIIFIITINAIYITTALVTNAYTKILLKSNTNQPNIYSALKENKQIFSYNLGFEKAKYDDITFMYRKSNEPGIELAKAYIDCAKEDCESIIGKLPLKPLVIKFDYDEKMFKDNSTLFDNFDGIYVHKERTEDRHINVMAKGIYMGMISPNPNTVELKYTLRHEYVHYSFDMLRMENNMDSNVFPVWFEEGVADYIAYSPDFDYTQEPPNSIIPFNELKNSEGWAKYTNKKIDTYPQSYYAVQILAANKGEGAIREIMLKTKEMGFEAAFKSVAGASVQEYEEKLRKYAGNDWKDYKIKVRSKIPQRDYNYIHKAVMEEYIKQNPQDVETMVEISRIYEMYKDYIKAKEVCESAIKKDPSFVLGWHTLGRYAERAKDYEAAEDHYKKSIELEPKNSGEYQALAQIYALSDINKSIETLEEGINVSTDTKFLSTVLNKYKKFNNDLKGPDPLKTYLTFIKGDTINSNTIKISMIEKVIKDNSNVSNKSRSELLELKKKLESEEH